MRDAVELRLRSSILVETQHQEYFSNAACDLDRALNYPKMSDDKTKVGCQRNKLRNNNAVPQGKINRG